MKRQLTRSRWYLKQCKCYKILLLIVANLGVFIAQTALAQDYSSEFRKYWPADTSNQLFILIKWQKASPQDPELFTHYFNYHCNRQEFQKGFEKIDEGIQLFPNRLDMRFGKIYVLAVIQNWEELTLEIINTIGYSSTNDNNWTWLNNKKKENGKDFLLSSIQTYQKRLFDTGDNQLLVNVRKIARKILTYYPDHLESLSNLAATYLITGENDKAIEILKQAEKLGPRNHVVISNLAESYKRKGDKQNAIEYYRKIVEFGNEREKTLAQSQIDALK